MRCRVEIAFHERNANCRCVKHGYGKARARQLEQCGAQERQEADYRAHGANGRGQEPFARIAGANKNSQVHEQCMRSRLELHGIAGFCIGDFLGVDFAERIEHVCAFGCLEVDRHLTDASVKLHAAHAVDFFGEFDKRVEVLFRHRARQFQAGPARDLFDYRELHDECRKALFGGRLGIGLGGFGVAREVRGLGDQIVDFGFCLFNHILIAVLCTQAACDAMHIGLLCGRTRKRLDTCGSQQEAAADEQGVECSLLHVCPPSNRDESRMRLCMNNVRSCILFVKVRVVLHFAKVNESKLDVKEDLHMEGMNVQTAVLLAVIVVGMVFAARRMYRVFSLKDDCCGGGAKDSSKKFKAQRVSDTNEANYKHALDLKIGGMTCEKCVENVQNAINSVDAGNVWARVDLGSKTAHILSKNALDQASVEEAVEAAGYFVSRR